MSKSEEGPQSVESYLRDLGEDHPVFGPPDTGELATDDPETVLRRDLMAVAQAAHDQIFGQGDQQDYDPTDAKVGTVVGEVYTHDPLTKTSFHIRSYDYGNDDGMLLRVESATPYDEHAMQPAFCRRHDMYLSYDGRVVSDTGMNYLNSTVFLEKDDPAAFKAMAESIARSTAIKPKQFEKANSQACTEFVTGHVGRLAFLKDILGLKPRRQPFSFR